MARVCPEMSLDEHKLKTALRMFPIHIKRRIFLLVS